MSPEAALHSDHVNLLIHRYLQESGFESTAKAFHVDWQRRPEYRDPENFPFAHDLRRNELASVIQMGLHYDGLRARARKTDRKFQWISRREHADDYVENGAGSRPSSSGRRKGHPSVPRASDDFPAPLPKRQRRSEGSDALVNGERDAAEGDVGDAEGEADAEAEEDGDAASPAAFSEPEATPAVRYDSVLTQTEFKAVPKTSTLSWTIDKPGAKLSHGSWNLGPEPRHARTLLAVGDYFCRKYEIPDSVDDTLQVDSLDEPMLPDDSIVMAAAWHPDGEAESFAIDSTSYSAAQSQMQSLSLFERRRNGSSAVFLLAPPELEPAGIVLSLRYSPNGEYLLAARTNRNRGLVQVWKPLRTDNSDIQAVHEPIAWRMLENPIHDVLWTGQDTFVVCGDVGLSLLYQVDGSQHQASEAQVTGSTAMRGLISLNSSILPAEHAWDHVRTDERHQMTAFASTAARKLVLTPRIHNPELTAGADLSIDLAGNLAALEFQPLQSSVDDNSADTDQHIPGLLAVAYEEGPCCLYSLSRQIDESISCTAGPALSLPEGESEITTIAWSRKGDYLAVCNADVVQIWHVRSLRRADGAAPDAYVTWRPALEAKHGEENEQPDDDEDSMADQPSLSWSSDDSLAYAADRQIAVLQFKVPQPETNGQSSPSSS